MTATARRGMIAVATGVVLVGVGAAVLTVAPGSVDVHRDLITAWPARILLVLAVAWIAIGILAARTSVVGRPGAAAARVTWIASTRPWRARESTLGMLTLDRWLIVLVPGALLVATVSIQTVFVRPLHLVVTLAEWAVFAATLVLLLRGRAAWPAFAAVGGVLILRCTLTLLVLSLAGDDLGADLLAVPPLLVAYAVASFALAVWVYVAAGWALAAGLGPRRAAGIVLAATGAGLAVPALVVALLRLDPATLDPLAGIAQVRGLRELSAWWSVLAGALLVAGGVALSWRPRRRTASGS